LREVLLVLGIVDAQQGQDFTPLYPEPEACDCCEHRRARKLRGRGREEVDLPRKCSNEKRDAR